MSSADMMGIHGGRSAGSCHEENYLHKMSESHNGMEINGPNLNIQANLMGKVWY